MSRPVVMLFAKAPVAGNVKTRLTPSLTPAQAAALHEALTAGTWSFLQQFTAVADLELHVDQDTDAWPEASPRRLQSDGDLGARMLHALGEALDKGRSRAIVLGSGTAKLPANHLTSLLSANADVALGPTEDGGYYAISCRKIHPDLFRNVRWSTPHALSDTVNAALGCGLSIQIGQPWFDIDGPEDLKRTPEEMVRSVLARHQ